LCATILLVAGGALRVPDPASGAVARHRAVAAVRLPAVGAEVLKILSILGGRADAAVCALSHF